MTLIERLEGLTGPCRETDAAIHEAVWNEFLGPNDDDHRRYTASVDAALTLVPFDIDRDEGAINILSDYGMLRRVRLYWDLQRMGPDNHVQTDGATLPIALCIAALKAREETE